MGDAQEIAAAYRARISAINEELRRIALRHGFAFVKHVTHRPAAETLLTLAGMIGGNAFPIEVGTGSRDAKAGIKGNPA